MAWMIVFCTSGGERGGDFPDIRDSFCTSGGERGGDFPDIRDIIGLQTSSA
jgi:hypothetical protein